MIRELERMQWFPRLLDMESELSKDLPDESDAIFRVARSVRQTAAGIRSPSAPLGRFMTIGPNNSARALAESLARFLYGHDGRTLRLDMRDYSEKHQVLRLVGHNGGLVCSYSEGDLTEPLRIHPQMVVVLEDLEKAHKDVWDLLIQAFEDGYLIDGAVRSVSINQAIFLMTTAIGYTPSAAQPNGVFRADGIRSPALFPDETRLAITSFFRPEMLRGTFIDDIILLR